MDVRDRVSFAALGVANVGAGVYIASEPAYIGADTFVTVLAIIGILLAIPPLIATVTGYTNALADEGLFVNGIYWAFITALFALARNDAWEWGLALILAGGTIASFALWLGYRRSGVADDG